MAKKTDDELIAQCEARLKALRKRKAAALRRAQTKRADGVAAQADEAAKRSAASPADARAEDGSAGA